MQVHGKKQCNVADWTQCALRSQHNLGVTINLNEGLVGRDNGQLTAAMLHGYDSDGLQHTPNANCHHEISLGIKQHYRASMPLVTINEIVINTKQAAINEQNNKIAHPQGWQQTTPTNTNNLLHLECRWMLKYTEQCVCDDDA